MRFSNRVGSAVIILVALSYLAFFYKLGDLAFIGADESRYAEVAREMTERRDYVTPTLDYRPWFEKPPFYYWTTAVFYRGLGVSEFSARLSSAVLALVGVLFVFFFARRIFSPRAGFLSAIILLTSGEYFVLGRAASTDLGLAVMLTMGFGCFYLGLTDPSPHRAYFSLASYVFFGLAVLAKGPIGILLPVLVILGYFVMTGQYQKVYQIQLLPGLLLFLLVVAPWHVLVIERHRFAFVASFFLNHNLARFFTRLHHHAQPAYYFLVVILVGFFPWSGFLPAALRRIPALYRRRREPAEEALLFLWMWAVALTLFFSLSQSKLAGYILPVIPALAILVGKEWDDFLNAPGDSAARLWIGCYLYVALAAVIMVALPVVLRTKYEIDAARIVPFLLLYACSIVLVVFWLVRRGRARLFYVIAATPIVMIFLTTQYLFPVISAYQSVKEIAVEAAQRTVPGQPIVSYQFEDYNLKYYAGLRPIQVVNSPEELAGLMRRRGGLLYCVAMTHSLSELEKRPEFQTTRLLLRGNKVLLKLTPSVDEKSAGAGPQDNASI